MNDIMKKNVILFSPIVLCVVMIIALFTSIPLEWVNVFFIISVITYVTLIIITWKHPRVQHYEKALKEFEKDYRYVKEIK